jgi:hypothetical protein
MDWHLASPYLKLNLALKAGLDGPTHPLELFVEVD